MPDELDFRSQGSPYGESEDTGGGKVAAALGVLIIVAIIGGAGYGIYRLISGLPSSDNQAGGAKPRYASALHTEFMIDCPRLDDSRYVGAIDTYYLRGLDQARKLVAINANYNAKIMEEYVPGLEGKSRTSEQSSGPPGKSALPAEVQAYYHRLGIDFLELPPDQVWGYDTQKREVYIGLRPKAPAAQ